MSTTGAARFHQGDRVVLGDSGLVVEVEADAEKPGDELSVGFAQTARDGLHLGCHRSLRILCNQRIAVWASQ